MDINAIYGKVKDLFLGSGRKVVDNCLGMHKDNIETITGDILPLVEHISSLPDAIKAIEKLPQFKYIRDTLKIKNLNEFLNGIKMYGNDYINNSKVVELAIKKNISVNLTNKTMTFKQLAIYNIVEEAYKNINVIHNVIYFIIRNESTSILPKMFTKNMMIVLPEFRNIVTTNKGHVSNRLKLIDEMPDGSVFDTTETVIPVDSLFNKASMEARNFTGNPIYSLGKFYVEHQIKKKDGLEEKKNLIELRLLELRTSLAGSDSDDKIKQQIEYYEDQLASIDAKIEQLERV